MIAAECSNQAVYDTAQQMHHYKQQRGAGHELRKTANQTRNQRKQKILLKTVMSDLYTTVI